MVKIFCLFSTGFCTTTSTVGFISCSSAVVVAAVAASVIADAMTFGCVAFAMAAFALAVTAANVPAVAAASIVDDVCNCAAAACAASFNTSFTGNLAGGIVVSCATGGFVFSKTISFIFEPSMVAVMESMPCLVLTSIFLVSLVCEEAPAVDALLIVVEFIICLGSVADFLVVLTFEVASLPIVVDELDALVTAAAST